MIVHAIFDIFSIVVNVNGWNPGSGHHRLMVFYLYLTKPAFQIQLEELMC